MRHLKLALLLLLVLGWYGCSNDVDEPVKGVYVLAGTEANSNVLIYKDGVEVYNHARRGAFVCKLITDGKAVYYGYLNPDYVPYNPTSTEYVYLKNFKGDPCRGPEGPSANCVAWGTDSKGVLHQVVFEAAPDNDLAGYEYYWVHGSERVHLDKDNHKYVRDIRISFNDDGDVMIHGKFSNEPKIQMPDLSSFSMWLNGTTKWLSNQYLASTSTYYYQGGYTYMLHQSLVDKSTQFVREWQVNDPLYTYDERGLVDGSYLVNYELDVFQTGGLVYARTTYMKSLAQQVFFYKDHQRVTEPEGTTFRDVYVKHPNWYAIVGSTDGGHYVVKNGVKLFDLPASILPYDLVVVE